MFPNRSLFPATPKRRIGLFARCSCALLALGIGGWASQAEATCGDYLMVGNDHFSTPSDAPRRAPCNGPHCSSDDAPLTTVQVVTPVVRDSTWACLADGGEVLSPSPRWAFLFQEAGEAQEVVVRLLRPPRLLSL